MAGHASIIELLRRDHHKVEMLLGELDAMPPVELGEYFARLSCELLRHELAEELVLYPALRSEVRGSDGLADACIAEQSAAEEELTLLGEEDPISATFRSHLVELREAVLTHALHEEVNVLPALEANADAAELAELGARYERALRASSPAPHAARITAVGVVRGPVAALVDRMRDAMHPSARA